MKSELETIPGVGKSITADLQMLKITEVSDLKGKDPQKLYDALCKKMGVHVDRCVLYVFRCAVYFASHTAHDQKKLQWWYWKDKNK